MDLLREGPKEAMVRKIARDRTPLLQGQAESCGCSAQKRKGSRKTSLQPFSAHKGFVRKTDFLPGPVVTRQG